MRNTLPAPQGCRSLDTVRRRRRSAPHRWSVLLQPAVLREVVTQLLVALFVEASLRTTDLRTTARRLGVSLPAFVPPYPVTSNDEGLPVWAGRRGWVAVRLMRRWPFGDTCLRRSLVLGQRLAVLHPQLHLGVTKENGALNAHAWLEVGGLVLDTEHTRFSRFTGAGG